MERSRLLNIALILSFVTVGYNIIEGLVSVYFGLTDDTLALLGFGVDSFVEVISGVGIAHMVLRMKYSEITNRDKFEKLALKITGFSFYLLTIGLLAGVVLSLVYSLKPETTMVGIIVSSISILTMYFLMKYKLKVGKELNSDAIIADANCTKTCFYLSFVLLASALLYELFQVQYFDLIGSLGIAWFAFQEGKEAFEKVRSNSLSCCCDEDCHS
ncbi:MAG: cation transporter [Bacteroidales bacterium]|nr:cation transporter [Bacteroidales bacterium]